MLSRSATVKLKAILVIDLIIIAVAAGVYFYLQDQGLVSGAEKPAEYVYTDLKISPHEVYAGEAVVISVNVTNIGDREGNLTVNLEINEVIKDTANITLSGNYTSEIVEFTYIEMVDGTYNVKVGDLTGEFVVKEAPPEFSKIILSGLKLNPYEAWPDDPVTVTVNAQNPTSEVDTMMIKISVDEVVVQSQVISMAGGATQTFEFIVNVTSEGKHTIKVNTLSATLTIVPKGYHTLTINRSGGGSKSLPFTLNGEQLQTPYTAVLPEGQYTLSVPNPFDVGTGVLEFSYWSDGVTTATRTFTLDKKLIIVATYTLISGYASCPSLYYWDGTDYVYVTEVSNAGWLGYIDYITPDGEVVFGGGNPWDHIKLDSTKLAIKDVDGDGYFDLVLFQQWDEIFYLDAAYMVVVDHPIGTDVYATMPNYINQVFNGQIYTVNKNNILTPISAVNEKGENVLANILQIDGIFTPGQNGIESPAWNNITLNQLTLNLGDLSNAEQIKLVMHGMVDWGAPEPYYTLIDLFKEAATQGLIKQNTQIYPAPYMEVKDANGNWIRVPQDKQMPHPSDYVPRSFVVDLTGVFPEGITNYELRITNFFNVTFDYIGIDVSKQEPIIIQTIKPTAILEPLDFGMTASTASGSFTRYGDVTALLAEADDMYIIGMQGDKVSMKFNADTLEPVPEGMERDYFLFVACWFKDPPGNWGYEFDFTVNPLPFIAMSGFPYPSTESYPYDAVHLAYLQQYNTRIIAPP
ncbi:MAG: hypothetical protein NWE95_09210 [Candidatus Bathyarchaeota archaeon]|nr:hypothetical protein [Candidatus Bathyarchaeota archaeon]